LLHNKLPAALVDKVDVPQLFTTVTAGVAGVAFGLAVPLPELLVHPFTVVVTVYVPAVFTVMVEAVAPLLHNRLPAALVDRVEVPLQLSCTETSGTAGVVFGLAVPPPALLVQPFVVDATVYVPAVVTVIIEDVSPVLHNRLPAALVESVDVPLQLSCTVTTGVDAVDFGFAVPLPASLVQPFTVVVTE
jgi:hypothetical protein